MASQKLPRSRLDRDCISILLSLVQGSAKEWSIGCVIPVSWLPLAAAARFTQLRVHSLAYSCMYVLLWREKGDIVILFSTWFCQFHS